MEKAKRQRGAEELLASLEAKFPHQKFRISTKGQRVQRKPACKWITMCTHNRKAYTCKECGGSSICEHNRRHSSCTKCVGGGVCEDGKIRCECRICSISLCPHGCKKHGCVPCKGAVICEPNKSRATCKECMGNAICPHMNVKYQCRERGGACFCTHRRLRRLCKECGGSGFCIHGRQKHRCVDCGTRTCKCGVRLIVKDGFCNHCHPDFVPSTAGGTKSACKFINGLAREVGAHIQHYTSARSRNAGKVKNTVQLLGVGNLLMDTM